MTGSGLRAENISVHFSGVRALSDVSLELATGEIVGLVGPNGAGKTTMVNVLSGFQRPHAGRIILDGAPAPAQSADWFARGGVVRSFQAVRLFRGLTVSENVEAALTSRGMGRRAARRRAGELLGYLGIGDKSDLPGDGLSYGDERRVGLARALALAPRYLLLDEPAAGMTLAEAEALGEQITQIRSDFSCSIMLIEHNMRLVTAICAHLHVLSGGRAIDAGSPEKVMANPQFRSAYLGEEYQA